MLLAKIIICRNSFTSPQYFAEVIWPLFGISTTNSHFFSYQGKQTLNQ